ncbi:MAG: FkbM family methyltransferase [Betaproteobacteria bacterium]
MTKSKLFAGLQGIRRAFFSPSKWKKSYSQCAEDLIVEFIFKSRPIKSKGFYVDVGAHHPRRGSNTYSLYKTGWRGILVDMEPDKVIAARLARPFDICVQAAVSDGERDVNVFSPGAFSTKTTIDPKSVFSDGSANFVKTASVRTTTLTDILDDNSCPDDFDFLNVDCEGHDLAVLRGLDFERYCPKVICVEIWEASKGIEALVDSEIHVHLSKSGYVLFSWAVLSAIYVRGDG